jgi:uncharacterized protein
MFFKIHKSYRIVVAICDSELVGKYFEEGMFQLDVKESFYKGQEAGEEEMARIIKRMSVEDSTFNIVGEKSISLAIDLGLIAEDGIKRISGIPFVMVLL